MLYKSGQNLQSGVVVYIKENKEITIFSVYLKLAALEEINSDKNIKEIIVHWDVQDFCLGASDIELYDYCKQNNIFLFEKL